MALVLKDRSFNLFTVNLSVYVYDDADAVDVTNIYKPLRKLLSPT